MKSIFPMPNSDPVQIYSLNFREQKEKNLAWDSRRLASRRLVRPMVQVTLATRRLVRTPSTFFPAKRPFFTQRTIPTIERKLTLSWWCFFRILYNVKEKFFHRCCSFRIQSILENGLIPGGHESDKGRQTVFFTPLNPFGGDSDEEEPWDDYTVLQNVHHHSH